MQKVINIYQDSEDNIYFIIERDEEKFIMPMNKFICYYYDEELIENQNYIEITDFNTKKSLIDEYNKKIILYMDNKFNLIEIPLDIKKDIFLCIKEEDKKELDENNLLNNFANKLIQNNCTLKIAHLSDILLNTINENNTLIYIIPNNSRIVIKTNTIDSNIILFKVICKDKSLSKVYSIYKHMINDNYNEILIVNND